ncbi:Sua5 YciO YrdC YwlC family protein, partial [Campylobacter jejuni]|nr:Sua5 YciO YrdC YwlC family protein [Campylobacter jejuni]HED0400159.1 Sua5 YciO YrdC YwlC family protein [Campylobacter jejuni]
ARSVADIILDEKFFENIPSKILKLSKNKMIKIR